MTINRKCFALAASREFQFSSKPAYFCSLSRSLRRLHFESCPEFLAVTHKKLVGCSSLLGFKAALLVSSLADQSFLLPGPGLLLAMSVVQMPPCPLPTQGRGASVWYCQTENTPMLGDMQARAMYILHLCAHENTNTCLLRVCLC